MIVLPDETPRLIDAHCHLADERLAPLDDELAAARQEGVGGFLSCALDDAECDFHLQLSQSDVSWCAGVHPHWEPSTAALLPRVESLADSGAIVAIGEIGLDRRGDLDAQTPLLERQLGIAHELRLPVVLHCVRAWYELHALLKKRFPRVRGLLHGFRGPCEVIELFADLDIAVSLGGGVTQRPDAESVIAAALQRGRVLVETDAPWQKPRWLEGEHNRLTNLRPIAEQVAELGGVDYDALLRMQWDTARDLELT